MKRLRSIPLLALVGLSACDSGRTVSPLAPELPDASFAKVELPAFEPPATCPVEHCLLEPVVLTREKKAPSRVVKEFNASMGEEAALVVYTSNPKTTTVKAWLNGEPVLLPSAMPRSGSDEIRVHLTLEEENRFELRLSAKPGTEVAIWIEGEAPGPTEPPGEPPTGMTFFVTQAVVAPTADMNATCGAERDGFWIADWTDVEAAEAEGTIPEDILGSGMAMILNNGQGAFTPPFQFTVYHYVISDMGADAATIAFVGTDLFWLTSGFYNQRVLCMGPSS